MQVFENKWLIVLAMKFLLILFPLFWFFLLVGIEARLMVIWGAES